MVETGSQTAGRRKERWFLLCAVLTAAVCVALAFWFAPPQRAASGAASEVPMAQLVRVDLNTADLETLCFLPGVGEKRAQAILDYRRENGPFRHVSDAAAVPGLNGKIVAEWEELAYVS